MWFDANFCALGSALGLLGLCITYAVTTFLFHKALWRDEHEKIREAPIVPYIIPGVYHALGFLDPGKLLSRLQRKFDSDTPLQLKAGPLQFFVFRNAEHIKAVYRASSRMANKSSTIFVLRNVFCLPKVSAETYLADDSGLRHKPRLGSNVAPENRINYLINSTAKKYLSANHLEDLDRRIMKILLRHLSSFDVGLDWVEFPDLFDFIHQVAMRPSLEAIVGSEFFKVCPGFIEDLAIFQHHIPDFLRLLPRWLIPTAYQVRERLLEGVKRWHQHAHKHYDCSRFEPEDPDWEPYFGSKLVRARESYALNAKGMTPDARATEGLGLIFGATTNVGASMFWFVFEAIKDSASLRKLQAEVTECTTKGHTEFDIKRLIAQPLLQSAYAEVLRLYVASAHSRIAEYEDINIAGYPIPKDSYILTYSRTSALDHRVWQQAGRTLKKPLEEFDAERFLVDPGWVRPVLAKVRESPSEAAEETRAPTCAKKRFSMEGLLGIWHPYGGGDHICPGQHYAKHQMILTFAVLFSQFDFQLMGPDAEKVRPNMKFAPYGGLPPVHKVPFRVRRKTTV